MPSAAQLAGRLERQLSRLFSGEGAGAAVWARANVELEALEGVLEREPEGPFSAELTR